MQVDNQSISLPHIFIGDLRFADTNSLCLDNYLLRIIKNLRHKSAKNILKIYLCIYLFLFYGNSKQQKYTSNAGNVKCRLFYFAS